MNVWKIDSQFGSRGCILDIFWKYQVVFIGNDNGKLLREVKKEDLIAVTRGFTVVAIAKVLSDTPQVIDHMGFDAQDESDFSCSVGVKVRFYILEAKDRLRYGVRRAFVCAHQISKDVSELYEKYSKKVFDINSTAYTLNILQDSNTSASKGKLLDGRNCQYVVPIYQRPYSWGQTEVEKLIKDIHAGYIDKEPVFIGAMQLSFPVLMGLDQQYYVREVIDGQQRLTTILLLMKTLKELYPESLLKDISLKWLETRVNNGQQQKSFIEAIDSRIVKEANWQDHDFDTNIYLRNIYLIKDIMDNILIDECKDANKTQEFDIDGFIRYISSSIYFVCIETQAGISKTIKIFNTINTAGLDLGGSDLFKIKFYEYLTTKKKMGEGAFEDISVLYEKIEAKNKDIERKITSMDEILDIYKYVVILKSGLPKWLFKTGKDTFFERLFDTISGAANWKDAGFGEEAKHINLDINDIHKLIDARYKYEEYIKGYNAEIHCCDWFIEWSRYSRFWMVAIIAIAYCNDVEAMLAEYIKCVTRLFIIYSCVYGKGIGEINYFMLNIIKMMVSVEDSSNLKAIISEINGKIEKCRTGGVGEDFEDTLRTKLTWNPLAKNLSCRLAAMLHVPEDYNEVNSDVVKILFQPEKGIDIEHIEPINHKDGSSRQQIWDTWGGHLHGIGNLVVLERPINRSISNNEHACKYESYQESIYKIVKAIPQQWNIELCKKRADEQMERVTSYIFLNRIL